MNRLYDRPVRPSAALNSSDFHEREHLWSVLSRAYHNVHNQALPEDAGLRKTLLNAALLIKRDARLARMDERRLTRLCEDMIRIINEHDRLARQHASRSRNSVYLRQIVVDNAIERQKYLDALGMARPQIASETASDCCDSHPSPTRKRSSKISSAEVMELAYQQLALTRP